MTLQQLYTFLIEHPDWSPTLRESGSVMQVVGVFGPQGSYYTLDAIAVALGWQRLIQRRRGFLG